RGAVLLRDVAGPVGCHHLRPRGAGEVRRPVLTPRVEDEHLVAEGDAPHAVGDAVSLVLRDDAGGDLHAAASPPPGGAAGGGPPAGTAGAAWPVALHHRARRRRPGRRRARTR